VSSSTTISGGSDLVVVKTHTGTFRQNDRADSYSIVVTNNAAATSDGTVSVHDGLPAGLTLSQIGGTGWTCDPVAVTCTRSDPVAPSGSYPQINVVTSVAVDAPPIVVNMATVSGGGEDDASNDSATDATVVVPLPDLTVTNAAVGNIVVGQTGAAFTITVANDAAAGPTFAPASVTVSAGAGFSPSALTGAGWSCDLPSFTCTRSDALDAGASYPAITLSGDIAPAPDAPQIIPVTSTVSGGGELNTANDTMTLSATVYSPAGVPAGFVAVTSGPIDIAGSWYAVLGVTSYVVSRATSVSGPWSTFTVSGPNFLDAGLAPDTTYLYKVQAADSLGHLSGYSAIDISTTTYFGNQLITAGTTIVQGAFLTSLRTAINAVRKEADLPAFAFTDADLPVGTVAVKAVHMTEARSALAEARAVIGLPVMTLHDPTITPGVTLIRRLHIVELRIGTK